MKVKKWAFLFAVFVFLISISCSSPAGEKLTEEQMTAYRTRPAVVLIYSGMFLKIALNNGQTFDIPNYGSGSGFFINPEGYLVTNGHVVDTYMKYTADRDGYAQKVLTNFIVDKIITEFKQTRGRQPTQQEINVEYMKFMRTYAPQVINHGAINYVLMSNSEYLRFEVKKFSPSIPEGGKDIAVLKIERDNCPVIMLGDSSKLALQQKVFTIGFPGVVDPQRFPLLGAENTLKASITGGAITALKTDFKGMSVIQHDSATSPGNSGGPTVDYQGRVIGVHSYATVQYEGFKFSVPINTAKEFIQDAGIEYNKPSEFTTVFNELMDSVWEESWFDARTHVSTALAYMKNEPDLERLQQMILRKISEMGFFAKMWQQNKVIVIIALILIIAILLVLRKAFKPSTLEGEAVPLEDKAAAILKPGKTKAAEEEATMLEGEVAGSVTVLVRGKEKGSYNVTARGLIVGRDPAAADVHISDNIVSKTHVKILPKGDQFYIVDLGSTNGTYVNGQKIKETVVTPDDLVQLGKKGDIKIIFKK